MYENRCLRHVNYFTSYTVNPKLHFFYFFIKGIAALLIMSGSLGLLLVAWMFPHEKRNQNFYLTEFFLSFTVFFIVTPIIFITKNSSMSLYVAHKIRNFKIYHIYIILSAKIAFLLKRNTISPNIKLQNLNNLI